MPRLRRDRNPAVGRPARAIWTAARGATAYTSTQVRRGGGARLAERCRMFRKLLSLARRPAVPALVAGLDAIIASRPPVVASRPMLTAAPRPIVRGPTTLSRPLATITR